MVAVREVSNGRVHDGVDTATLLSALETARRGLLTRDDLDRHGRLRAQLEDARALRDYPGIEAAEAALRTLEDDWTDRVGRARQSLTLLTTELTTFASVVGAVSRRERAVADAAARLRRLLEPKKAELEEELTRVSRDLQALGGR